MKTKTKITHILHSPVLADEVIALLDPKKGESYLDLTAGYGGHATLVLERTKTSDAVLCDRDSESISYLKQSDLSGVLLLKNNFSKACDVLIEKDKKFDMILADLGVSSPHLDKANRGFSVSKDGPLDMRMDQSTGKDAAELVNSASEAELATILRVYGEEPKARKIARMIVEQRPFERTSQLAECIKRAYGGYSKHHPAIRSFQALRIAVNDELGLLQEMLPKAVNLLAPGGRLGVITFHSLEDRIVKQFFVELTSSGYESEFELIAKKPLVATLSEIRSNPRARSAKLRGVVKK